MGWHEYARVLEMKLCRIDQRLSVAMKRSARRLAFAAAVAALTTTAASAQQLPADWIVQTQVTIPSPSDAIQPSSARSNTRRSISDLGTSSSPKLIRAARETGAVQMAGAVAPADSETQESDSLLDLDMPIPGIPSPQAAANKPIRLPRLGRVGSNIDADTGTSRQPRVASKGGKMKIRIEPVRLDAETGEVLRLGVQSSTSYDSPSPSDVGVVGNAATFDLSSAEAEAQQALPGLSDRIGFTDDTVMRLSDSPSPQKPAASNATEAQATFAAPTRNKLGGVEISLSDTQAAPMNLPSITDDTADDSGIAPQTPTFSIDDSNESAPVAESRIEVPQTQPTAFSMRDNATQPPASMPKPAGLSAGGTSTKNVEATQDYKPAQRFTNSTMPYRKAATPAMAPVANGPKLLAGTQQLSADELSGTPMSVGESMVVTAHGMADLSASSRIIEYSVEHPSICRLIRTGESTLSVVGLQEGSTRVAVVTASANGSPQTVEVRAVAVRGGGNKQVEQKDFARDITQTISKLYPRCQISVVNRGGEIVIRGFANTEKEARRILSMVRKATLSPVVDEVRSFVR